MIIDYDKINKMTLREVMECITGMDTTEGPLVILFAKVASEIDRLENRISLLEEIRDDN